MAAGSLNTTDNELNYLAQAKWNHFDFQLGRLTGLDRNANTIQLAATLDNKGNELVPARSLKYDTLVLAVGSLTNDFGTPGASELHFLDCPQNAQHFHQRLFGEYLSAHTRDSNNGSQCGHCWCRSSAWNWLNCAMWHACCPTTDWIISGQKHLHQHPGGRPRILPALSDKLATTAHKELLKLE